MVLIISVLITIVMPLLHLFVLGILLLFYEPDIQEAYIGHSQQA